MLHGRAPHAELDALIERRQITVRPQRLAADRVSVRIAQHHVCRQILILRAQGVADPCAHHRPAGEDLAGEQHVQPFEVIVVLGVHRADEAQVVDDARRCAAERRRSPCRTARTCGTRTATASRIF